MKECAIDITTHDSWVSILVDNFFLNLVMSEKLEGENAVGVDMIKYAMIQPPLRQQKDFCYFHRR